MATETEDLVEEMRIDVANAELGGDVKANTHTSTAAESRAGAA